MRSPRGGDRDICGCVELGCAWDRARFAPSRGRGRPAFRPGRHVQVARMEHEELLEAVRGLRRRRYSPAEIARALGLSKADAARLVRIVACERDSASAATGESGHERSCAREPDSMLGQPGLASRAADRGSQRLARRPWRARRGKRQRRRARAGRRAGRRTAPVRVQLPGRHVVPWSEERARAEADGQARFRGAQARVLRSVGVAGHSDPGRARPEPRARGGRVRATSWLRAAPGLPAGSPAPGAWAGGPRSRSAATASRTTSMVPTRTRSECWRRSSAPSAAAASTTRVARRAWRPGRRLPLHRVGD